MISSPIWSRALAFCSYGQKLATTDRRRLRESAENFLRTKSFDGAADFELTAEIRTTIALKACVPVLELGLDHYSDWRDIVVYPGDFRVDDEFVDEVGVVHRAARELCGQSLNQGPMVLSWQTIVDEQSLHDRDLVIHECAHKLDILNGDANGFPPLQRGMSREQWTQTFTEAFERFGRQVEDDEDSALDPYAATDPAEFFAVLSETFFTCPVIIDDEFPAVYAQLVKFYRQDPLTVLHATS